MEAQRFDRLARALSTTPTRRQFLMILAKGTAGTSLAALVAVPGSEKATAGHCRKIFKPCTQARQCCQHKRGRVICAENPQSGLPPGTICCVAEGERCSFGGQCCEARTCSDLGDGPVCV
jgi:hypothetical protein